MNLAVGLCQCGCGEPAPIAKRTDSSAGHTKGQSLQFIHGHNRRRPLADRLWEKVDVRGPDDCWEWQGSLGSNGYGDIGVEGGLKRTHRVAYELAVGPIPEGLCVCHTCDNRVCCNFLHLFLGTQQDNVDDMWLKRRGRSGGTPRLSFDDVLMIRHRAEGGELQVNLAGEYGVSQSLVNKIVRRKARTVDYQFKGKGAT